MLPLMNALETKSFVANDKLCKQTVTSLGHQEERRVFWEGSSFFNYVQ